MNAKTARLIRKFATEMGIDPAKEKLRYRAMKGAHSRASWLNQARGTKLMRDTLAA